MLLAIDCGNTNTLFAIHDGESWTAQWRAGTDTSRTADEHAVWLSQLMAIGGHTFNDITACIISTVVPQALFNLRNLSRRYFDVEPFVIGEPGVELGVEVLLERPQDAGADRLVNALGCHVEYGGPLIIVDSGTATTLDVITEEGGFAGGIIAPGINLSMQALHAAAAQLPRIAIRKPDKVIGTDTVSAMQSGVFWGYIDLIDGLVKRVKEEFGAPMKTIATGGVAALFEGASTTIDVYDPDVTIRGLYEIWRRNGGAV